MTEIARPTPRAIDWLDVSDEVLRAEVVRLLDQNLSLSQVAEALNVTPYQIDYGLDPKIDAAKDAHLDWMET